jgi:hypothetical protein
MTDDGSSCSMVAALIVGIKLKTGIFWWYFTASE